MTLLSLSNLKPSRGSKQYPKRVGRGNASGKGTTAGRGTKGQKARTGGRKGIKVMGLRRLVLQTPKLRGFKSISKAAVALVGLEKLNEVFRSGDVISRKTLSSKGLIPASATQVKILGGVELKKKLIVVGCLLSAPAKEKILAAGGEVR
jgi:large subunit ribosomal protein L15